MVMGDAGHPRADAVRLGGGCVIDSAATRGRQGSDVGHLSATSGPFDFGRVDWSTTHPLGALAMLIAFATVVVIVAVWRDESITVATMYGWSVLAIALPGLGGLLAALALLGRRRLRRQAAELGLVYPAPREPAMFRRKELWQFSFGVWTLRMSTIVRVYPAPSAPTPRPATRSSRPR